MSMPSIPTSYTHKLNPIAPFDVDLDATVDATVDAKMDAKMDASVDAKHSGSLDTRVTGGLDTNSKVDILNLPHFSLQDIKDMMKVRMHIPNYSNICFKMMGMELFSICIGGEAQVITEPYVPTAAEKCDTDCCAPDTRPFPESRTTKDNDPSPDSILDLTHR